VGFDASDHSLHAAFLDGNGYRSRSAYSLAPSATSAATLLFPINHCYAIYDFHPTEDTNLEAVPTSIAEIRIRGD
jgi:hypothetical protein